MGDVITAYDEVTNREALKEMIESKLETYNNDPRNLKMDLVLFKDAV